MHEYQTGTSFHHASVLHACQDLQGSGKTNHFVNQTGGQEEKEMKQDDAYRNEIKTGMIKQGTCRSSLPCDEAIMMFQDPGVSYLGSHRGGVKLRKR